MVRALLLLLAGTAAYAQMRSAIEQGTFGAFRESFYAARTVDPPGR